MRDDPLEYARFCETYVPVDEGPISSDANTSESDDDIIQALAIKPTEEFSDGEGEIKIELVVFFFNFKNTFFLIYLK